MDFKEKKKRLKKYPELLIRNQQLKISIREFEERAKALATSTTPGSLDKVRTAGGKNNLNKISAFAEKDETKEELIRQQKRVDNEIIQILMSIDSIECLEHKNAVYYYYIIGLKDYEIGAIEGIGVGAEAIRKRRNKGIKAMRFVSMGEVEEILS